MSKKIKILTITERRADYSRYKPIIDLIKKSPSMEYNLIVTGMHLLKEHGLTINQIKKDKFKVFHKINSFAGRKKSDEAMVYAMGKILCDLSRLFAKYKPDLVLTGFDIGANFALCVAGAHFNIPVLHIQGGEVSGSIDESIRHAMSKFSNYHFVANQDARKRLIKMGEDKNKIFTVGCPSLDALRLAPPIDIDELSKKFKINFRKKFLCVLQHPVTTEKESSKKQILETFKAIKKSKLPSFIIMPNNDAGYEKIANEITLSGMSWAKTISLSEYKVILKNCSILIGNSSSGIHEAATFKKPVINIGTRQNKRLKSKNVIDVNYNYQDIYKKIQYALNNKKYLNMLKKISNPYGDGFSANKIVKIIKKIDLNSPVQKTITY